MQASDRFNAAAEQTIRPSFLAEVQAAGALHAGTPVCVHRTPLLLGPTAIQSVQRSLPPIHRLLRRVREVLLADLSEGPRSLAAQFGMAEDHLRWAQLDPGFVSVAPLARLDAYVVDGVPKFLELNAESPAGMGYASAIAPVVERDPAWAVAGLRGRFFDPLPAVLRTVRSVAHEYGIRAARFRVAIVDFRGVATAPEFELLAEHFRRAGHPTSVLDPRELHFDGRHLSGPDGTIDLVFRRFLLRDLRQRERECTALLAAYGAGRVCMVNSLRTSLLHNKGIFALLHDPRFSLTSAEQSLVSRHIPETYLLSAGRRDRWLVDQNEWVCKPVDAHGGKGVVLGWTATPTQWEAALSQPDPHVVQRRVPAPTGAFFDARDNKVHRRVVDLGPFLARGRFAGFLCRLAEGELANVSAGGASQVPVFSLTERP